MKKNELVALGLKIKALRASLQLSQEQFAQACGLAKNYIGMLERGERNPSYLTLLKIARGHHLSIKQLL